MYVALDGGEQDLAGILGIALLLLRLDEGLQPGHCLLHHPGGFHHLGQEHLALAEQVADPVHAGHQGSFDHMQGTLRLQARGLGVLVDVFGDALDQGVRQALGHRPGAPLQILLLYGGAVPTVVVGNGQQPLGGVLAAIEDYIFHAVPQLLRQVVIDGQLAGVDDAHVHARLDGVVEENGVDGLAHRVVAAEGEGDIGNTAGDQGVGQGAPDIPGGVDEIQAVAVMLRHAGGHGEDGRVEDDVLRREAGLFREDLVGATADLHLALVAVRLALLVEGHDDGGGAVAVDQFGLLDEVLLPLLEGDGVDDALALQAFESGLQHLPLGGVDHHRHLGDVRLAADQVQETHHAGLGVQHGLVQVDVDDLGAVLHLLAGHTQGGLVLLLHDQPLEAGGAGDVGALAHVQEQALGADIAGLQSRQAALYWVLGDLAWWNLRYGVGNCLDEVRRGTTTATDDVEKTALSPLFDQPCHILWGVVVTRGGQRVGQAGIGVGGDESLGDIGELLHILTQLIGT